MIRLKHSYEADICLILEGTYPYVSGGVSSWVHSLIQGLHEFSFSLVLLLAEEKKREVKYKLPDNVVKLHHVYLQHEDFMKRPWDKRTFNDEQYDALWNMHTQMPFVPPEESTHIPDASQCPFAKSTQQLSKTSWNPEAVLYSEKTWNMLVKLYHMRNSDESFLDYVWTWRFLHMGMLATMDAKIPKCRMYHTVCTGYAGLLAARASIQTQRPMLLTEHGIYSKERKIEVSRANWVFERSRSRFKAEKRMSHLKQIWINAFRVLSSYCYTHASEIITLFEGNQRLQQDDGAPTEKLRVIPNGVDFQKLSQIQKESHPYPIIGFVGRVVSIKDVKTFIRAIRRVVQEFPNTEILIMGPTDEEPKYFEECQALAQSLGLDARLRFTGNIDLQEYYSKIDVLVLTSLSEGQPLVIMEAQCVGIPVVATDVGACRELLEGAPGDDDTYGPSGIVTGLSHPEQTADGILSFLRNPKKAKTYGQAGQQRMKHFYDQSLLYTRYRQLYQNYCQWQESDSTSKNS